MNAMAIGISGWATPPDAMLPLLDTLRPTVASLLPWEALLESDDPLVDAFRPGPTPRVFVGWSLGAMLGLRAMARGAIRPAAAVLISGAARFTQDGDWPGACPRMLRAMTWKLTREPAAVVRQFAETCLEGDACLAFVDRFTTSAEAILPATLRAGLEWLAAFDIRDAISRVDVPVLVLHGKADAIVPWTASQRLAEALPRAELATFAGGHALPLLHAEPVAHRVREFLGSHGLAACSGLHCMD